MQIHQILPDIKSGDAIGNETLLLRDILRESGFTSEIYAKNFHPTTNSHPYEQYKTVSSKDNILIYHYSIGSDVSDFIRTLPDQLVLIYHNQTPERYFWGVNDRLAGLLHKGREDLKDFVKITCLGLGDSAFNCRELQEQGFSRTDVLPLIIDFGKYSVKNKKIIHEYDDQKINLIFVGRISPNKRQDEVIRVFYYFKHIHPDARLFLIGGHEGCEAYYQSLKNLIAGLSLTDVYMPGAVSDSDLNSYYTVADAFLCMSEHEGFCVPLVESMYFGIPIIANNTTAIPDTLGGSGILLNSKNYCEIAELIHVILRDEKVRRRLVEKQSEVFQNYQYDKTREKFLNFIRQFLQDTDSDNKQNLSEPE